MCTYGPKLPPSTSNYTARSSTPRHHAPAVSRPFYIIGHMANSLEEVDKFLREGSNALEADIEFANNGTVMGTYHGVPCDCFRSCYKRERIAKFLRHIRDITAWNESAYRGQMSVLFLDLKTAKLNKTVRYTAGWSLAQNILIYLWKGVEQQYRMNVLLCINYVKDSDVIAGALAYMRKYGPGGFFRNIGFDVGMNDALSSIGHMYERLGIKGHRWQGDGLTNCLRFLMPLDRLLKTIKLRESKHGYVDKVYHWTIDLPVYIENSIWLGVDGIITNVPMNVYRVVTSQRFRGRLRVANIKDNPWQKIPRGREEIEEAHVYSLANTVSGGGEGK
ncbi:dermonecrotic toxin SPH [Rhipicephalus sanguineus]|uniref:dermonecrotic toxin SPH n=1 Tax=Rhipicephalus sanguineus TaxID=34632 RepID=UPI0020C1D564|nr:dermonecrotic toxin SPH [Rhipicephalus sanguineus]